MRRCALTPFWLLGHGLWLALLAYVGALVVLQLVVSLLGVPPQLGGWMLVGLHLLIGYEADALHRWSLDRQGFHTIATVNGQSVEECERRFFDAWLDGQPYVVPTLATGQSRSGAGRLTTLSLWGRNG
ncbi:MAG: DUF2628 domain-containing protein [Hyphomicrobiaceae bacterium]